MTATDAEDLLIRKAQRLAALRAVAEIEALLERAETIPPSAPGFSGADPYEIAQRYAIGDISREEMLDELTRWPYTPSRPLGEPIDTEYELGDWDTGVLPAVQHGLLSDADYEELFRRTEAATG